VDSRLRISTHPAELPVCPVGDLLCVRAFAGALLDEQYPHSPFRRDARLILTAACRHLQADAAAAPILPDLLELLARVAAGPAPEPFWAPSRTQFLQYAGIELAALDPDEFKHAIEARIGASARRRSELDRLPAPSKGKPRRSTRKAVRRSVKTTPIS
jgi:hypothetical protein